VFFFLIAVLPLAIYAQPGSDTMPYKKYPTLPAFDILLTDSSTIFNTFNIKEGKPTILFYFSPDCDHCKKVTENIIKHINELKGAQIYMFTMLPLRSVREFAEEFELRKYKNITIGKDKDWFFPEYYGARYVPFIVIYDSNKKLVRAFEGGAKIDTLISAVNEGKK
jgi:thiol-disulfide isomerase/thioredoxin